MKKIIFISLVFLIVGCSNKGTNSYSSSYERFLDCQLKAIDSFETKFKQCSSLKSIYENSICSSKMYKEYALDVCSSNMAVSLNSVSELYKLMTLLYDPSNNKVYSEYQRQQYAKELWDMIGNERRYANSILIKEADARESAFNQSRANSNLFTALTILGAQSNSVNNYSTSSPFKTYILNGKMISCSTIGNLTSCN